MSSWKYRGTLFVLSLFAGVLISSPSQAEFALGAAATVLHSEGNSAVTARYDFREQHIGVYGLYFDGVHDPNSAVAADLNIPYRMFDFSLGGAYVGKLTRINGTHYNFSLRMAANLSPHWRIEVVHLSNGNAIFGWHKDKDNLGWNFIGAAYRF